MLERVLIFAAHPDDELFMGGTLYKLSQAGTQVHVLQMTDGDAGYKTPDMKDKIVAARREEAAACDKVMGIRERIFLEQPDMGLTYSKDIVLRCLSEIRRIRPQIIFTHGPDDTHADHRATCRISLDAYWQAGNSANAVLGDPWKTPITYYYAGVQRPMAQVRLDVSDTVHMRYEGMATQTTQFASTPERKERLLAKARQLREGIEVVRETFWVADTNIFFDFPLPAGVAENCAQTNKRS